jgi:quinol monooxygenase YgiN
MSKYGMFNTFIAQPGKRDELVDILLQAAESMQQASGCLVYIVNKDAQKEDHIHVTEIWETAEDHAASLTMEGASNLIAKAVPLLKLDQTSRVLLEVVGGKGID